jgi:hypothetical protein
MVISYTLLEAKRKGTRMGNMLKQITGKIISCIRTYIGEEIGELDFFYKQYT